jgi:hypothetical protein
MTLPRRLVPVKAGLIRESYSSSPCSCYGHNYYTLEKIHVQLCIS